MNRLASPPLFDNCIIEQLFLYNISKYHEFGVKKEKVRALLVGLFRIPTFQHSF